MKKLTDVLSRRFIPDGSDITERGRIERGVSIVFIMFVIAIIWGAMYYFLGYKYAALGPAFYIVFNIPTFLIFSLFRNYYGFINVNIANLVFAPTLVHILFGNMHNSSLVLIWNMLPPVGAIFLLNKKRTMIIWLIIDIAIIVLTFLFEEPINNFVVGIPLVNVENSAPYELGLLMNCIGLALLFFVLLIYSRRITYQTEEQIEHIIFDSFPEPIAKQIISKDTIKINAEEHQSVTIMFVKFIDQNHDTNKDIFSDILPVLFRYLDKDSSELGIYKIKTVSEIFVAGSGLFGEENVNALLKFSFKVAELVEYINERYKTFIHFQIGINSGYLISGVIGQSKKIYDIWGDTVNVASRMASTSHIDSIIVSSSTYDKIKFQYETEKYDEVHVKGKGDIDIYKVLREKQKPQEASAGSQ